MCDDINVSFYDNQTEEVILVRPIAINKDLPDQGTLANSLAERLSQELVIALVGPVGSGVSTTANILREQLSQRFSYEVAPIIKPSDIIKNEAHRVGKTVSQGQSIDQYVNEMQDYGNLLRQKFGPDYLAEKVIENIAKFRAKAGGYAHEGHILPGRRAYIIDSIKNLEELNLIRSIYRETLCLFGVFAPDEIRHERLVNDGAINASVDKIIRRDEGEVATFGQMTRKVFVQSDFFVCNDQKYEQLEKRVGRFLDLIFEIGIHTATKSESAMYEADAASLKSACMSRQVGAAIISARGELISVGWNDVPKFGGSLYTEEDQDVWVEEKNSLQDHDHRCFKWGGKICHNEIRREDILDSIVRKIAESDFIKEGTPQSDIRSLMKGTKIDDLIEFSRSIHAEMEAILSVAREGRHSLVGATLYTTTYPCHGCARHIVASGIANVIYIQPYKKSLAVDLHHDAISENPVTTKKVRFRQYDGVAPHLFMRLFRSTTPRKSSGKFASQVASKALPLFQVPLDGAADTEAKVIADLSEKELSAPAS